MDTLRAFLHLVASNFGALVALYAGIVVIVAYWRGELGGLIAFLREMLEGTDGKASSKNAGYFMGAAVLCWSYAKITLAICRRIDSMQAFDPTWIFGILVSVIAGLVGVVVLGASAIQANLRKKLGMQDGPAPPVDKVESLTVPSSPAPKAE